MYPEKLILVLLIVVVAINFTSCEKDGDDISSLENYLKIGDHEYELQEGHIANEGDDFEGGSNYDGYETVLSLYSYQGIEPKDVFIAFEMYTNTGLKLDDGKYTYNAEKPYQIRSIGGGDYEECTNDECYEAEIAAGDITVSRNGNTYTITIDCEDENGKKITGFYKGTLAYLDFQGLQIPNNYASIGKTNNSNL